MSPHQNRLPTIYQFQYKKRTTLNYPRSAAIGFFIGAQERVRYSRGKPAISVRASEVLLYLDDLTEYIISVKYEH